MTTEAAWPASRRGRGTRALRLLIGCWLLAAWSAVAVAQTSPAMAVKQELETAKKLGAKGILPNAWWDLDARLRYGEQNGLSAGQWEALRQDALRLANAAAFLAEMRKQKSGLEAVLGRFDQALHEIAALHGVAIAPTLSGSEAADDLLEKLTRRQLRRQVTIDSLTVENRRLIETVGGRAEAQEVTITALQVELSALRQKLWETELRAGVAEADRSAAETKLTRRQQREQAVAATRTLFGPDEADIVLTTEGVVVIRLFGVSFGVGSAVLGGGQDELVDRIVEAIRLYPGGAVSLEGHTDDTGGREANLRLSRRRAETVARLLESRLGWDEGAIATEGLGPDRPIALNDSADGRARNRRIDVLIGQPE